MCYNSSSILHKEFISSSKAINEKPLKHFTECVEFWEHYFKIFRGSNGLARTSIVYFAEFLLAEWRSSKRIHVGYSDESRHITSAKHWCHNRNWNYNANWKIYLNINVYSKDSSASVVAAYQPTGRGSIPRRRKYISLNHHIQTGCGPTQSAIQRVSG